MPAPRIPSPPDWPAHLAHYRMADWQQEAGPPPPSSGMAEAAPLVWAETEGRRRWHAARQRYAREHGCKISETRLVWTYQTRVRLEAELEAQRRQATTT